MTATETERDLFAGPELSADERADLEEYLSIMAEANETDLDTGDYVGLRPDHHVCNCGTCGRLLLARRHAKERHDNLYAVTDGDKLPPVCFRKRVVVSRGVTRAVPVCKACHDDPESVPVPAGDAL